jgi:hypothetical protein
MDYKKNIRFRPTGDALQCDDGLTELIIPKALNRLTSRQEDNGGLLFVAKETFDDRD